MLRLSASDQGAVLSISDNGPGIPEDLKARLFTPFVTSRPDGLGLGLVISQDIMTDAGGVLRHVDRPEGSGACFEMILRPAT